MLILIFLYFRRKVLAPRHMAGAIIKCFGAAIIMTAIVFALDKLIPAQGGKIMQLLIIALKGVVAVVVYFLATIFLKMEEATFWISRFKAKLPGRKS